MEAPRPCSVEQAGSCGRWTLRLPRTSPHRSWSHRIRGAAIRGHTHATRPDGVVGGLPPRRVRNRLTLPNPRGAAERTVTAPAVALCGVSRGTGSLGSCCLDLRRLGPSSEVVHPIPLRGGGALRGRVPRRNPGHRRLDDPRPCGGDPAKGCEPWSRRATNGRPLGDSDVATQRTGGAGAPRPRRDRCLELRLPLGARSTLGGAVAARTLPSSGPGRIGAPGLRARERGLRSLARIDPTPGRLPAERLRDITATDTTFRRPWGRRPGLRSIRGADSSNRAALPLGLVSSAACNRRALGDGCLRGRGRPRLVRVVRTRARHHEARVGAIAPLAEFTPRTPAVRREAPHVAARVRHAH